MSLDPCMPHYSTTQSDIGLVKISFPACCVSHRATGLPTGMSHSGWSQIRIDSTLQPCGPVRPCTFCSNPSGANVASRSMEHSLPWNFRSSGANVSRTFIPMKLSFRENEYSKNLCSKCPKTQPKLAISLTIAYVH